MGTWSWTREAQIVGKLRSQGLTGKDIIDLMKSGGREGLLELVS
ncbi:hypothetical protein LCGC14_2356560 [marine sediment metagenome]|uniref:Uncharacterized protein n=1 Tax=marine sediment metagenome TaxID=412755 RepID=A0A0F9F2Q5_9ZZZZ